MIKTTIGEVINQVIDTSEHHLYVYRDGDTVFYVGQSGSPADRLMEHLGKDRPWVPDRVGTVILENMPQSNQWQIEMYTLRDCIEFMRTQAVLNFYVEHLDNLLFRRELINDAEDAMIGQLKPCLNIIKNTRNRARLPEKYQPNKNTIANEGVKLG